MEIFVVKDQVQRSYHVLCNNFISLEKCSLGITEDIWWKTSYNSKSSYLICLNFSGLMHVGEEYLWKFSLQTVVAVYARTDWRYEYFHLLVYKQWYANMNIYIRMLVFKACGQKC